MAKDFSAPEFPKISTEYAIPWLTIHTGDFT